MGKGKKTELKKQNYNLYQDSSETGNKKKKSV